MKRHSCFSFIAVASAIFAASCTSHAPGAQDAGTEDTMFQISTLQSLMTGNYDGAISVGELLSYGDIGIGTFDRIDGEMIVLDGKVYQAKADGKTVEAEESVLVPFASATHFDNDHQFTVEGVSCLDSLLSRMTGFVETDGPNYIHAVRIDVKCCDSVKVRSVLPQQKPYKPLAEVVKTDQREFTFKDLDGTIVGVRFPAYMEQLNAVGWHCHFISSDRTMGGHLLDISFRSAASVRIDRTTAFTLDMPEEEAFANSDLARDLSAEIEIVEK